MYLHMCAAGVPSHLYIAIEAASVCIAIEATYIHVGGFYSYTYNYIHVGGFCDAT